MKTSAVTIFMLAGFWAWSMSASVAVRAADEQPAAAQAQSAATAGSATAVPAAETEKPKTQVDDARAQLSGTKWALELKPVGAGKAAKDTVSFEGRKLSSERLMKDGYLQSNYTLRIEGDTPVIETMQAKEDGGAAFWRWEISGATAQGVVTEQNAKGEAEQYAFSGQESTGKVITLDPALPVDRHALAAAAAAQAAGEPAAQAAADTSATPAQMPTKREKRGWFW